MTAYYFLLGFGLGAAVLGVVWLARGGYVTPVPEDGSREHLPPGAAEVLSALESTSIVLDPSDLVISASPSAEAYGLVRRGRLVHDDITALVRAVRNDRVIRAGLMQLRRRGTESAIGDERLVMSVRVTPLGRRGVLVLAQDKTQEERVERMRRDFIANVSHELKTPVGGLSLLSEAVLDAREDPEAVRRFASRMQVEARRLTRLVTDIVDLTRLQGADVPHEPRRVDVGAAVREAVDSMSLLAEAKDIELQTVAASGLEMLGEQDLIVTAVRNLLANAVHYSEPGTRVAVRAQQRGEEIQIVVADHGLGIPLEEQGRIFERFYRVDPARSRATGGTGLGLAIVKHVCAIHGGTVSVWSQEGRGSTFTISLPASAAGDAPDLALEGAQDDPPGPGSDAASGDAEPAGASGAAPAGGGASHTDRRSVQLHHEGATSP